MLASNKKWNEQPSANRLQAAFPLFLQKDFEAPVNTSPFLVGVDKDYPARLREMISAAIVTYCLQNRSIDHVMKKHLKDMSYEEDPGGEFRLDRKFRMLCNAQIESMYGCLRQYPEMLDRLPKMGELIGDLTLVRVVYSLERAFSEADKGALFESVAIARMILEQACWSYVIRDLDDAEKIRSVLTRRCIRPVSRRVKQVGPLYGWMSNHVHWDYSAHVKNITSRDGVSAVWSATSEFKAISYAMLIALTYTVFDIFCLILKEYPNLDVYIQTNNWVERHFDPINLIGQIYDLTNQSDDILAILNLLKEAGAHG